MTKDDTALGQHRPSLELERAASAQTPSSREHLDGQSDRLTSQPSLRSKGSRGLTRLRSLNPFKVCPRAGRCIAVCVQSEIDVCCWYLQKGADFGFNPEELTAQKVLSMRSLGEFSGHICLGLSAVKGLYATLYLTLYLKKTRNFKPV